MRISDWSSDVCSSDLRNVEVHADDAEPRIADAHRRRDRAARFQRRQVKRMAFLDFRPLAHAQRIAVPAASLGASAAQTDGGLIPTLLTPKRRGRERPGHETAVGLLQPTDN